MSSLWQDVVAILLAAAAAVYVVRRLRRLGRGRQTPGCGACTGCPKAADPQQPTLIELTETKGGEVCSAENR